MSEQIDPGDGWRLLNDDELTRQASEGIEPHRTNYCIKDLQKGKFTIRNPHLQELLHKKEKDNPEIWESIAHPGQARCDGDW